MQTDKLMTPLNHILNERRADLLPLLGGQTMQAVLRNDEAMRTIARYSYALLPGLVRLAVKEPAYTDFVLANRDKVAERLFAVK